MVTNGSTMRSGVQQPGGRANRKPYALFSSTFVFVPRHRLGLRGDEGSPQSFASAGETPRRAGTAHNGADRTATKLPASTAAPGK